MKPAVKIKDWYFRGDEDGEQMVGFALDHPRLGAMHVVTSLIVKKDIENKRVETRNTVYELVGDGFGK
jgi:hypothetical protein